MTVAHTVERSPLESPPETVPQFETETKAFRDTALFRPPLLWGIGRTLRTPLTKTLASARFPLVNGPEQNLGAAAVLVKVLDVKPEGIQVIKLKDWMIDEALKYFAPFEDDGKKHRNVEVLKRARHTLEEQLVDTDRTQPLPDDLDGPVACFIFDDVPPRGVVDATLRLYGLSLRIFHPGQLNLEGLSNRFPNVAWDGVSPYDADCVDAHLMDLAFDYEYYGFAPHAVGRLPSYMHCINALRMGVEIAGQHQVPLGTYLGRGTKVMHGAALMLTERNTVDEMNGFRFASTGRNCRLLPNSVLGISVGDAVVVSAGVAVMPNSWVRVVLPGHRNMGAKVKASGLEGINAVTFSRDREGELQAERTPTNKYLAMTLKDGEAVLTAHLVKAR